MARPTIPNALEMRRLKYENDVPPAERASVAAALRAAGRRSEAILLSERRPDDPALLEDLAKAVADGSGFHVLALRKMGVPVTDEQVRACAVAAEAKGRWYDAHRAYTVLADEASLARVRERLPGFQPAVPANKA